MTTPTLDAAITAVARDLTRLNPPPDFRARVLDALPAARPRRWRSFAVAASLAGLAALLALLFLAPAVSLFDDLPLPAAAVVSTEVPAPNIVEVPANGGPAAVRAGDAAPSPAELAWRARAVPTLPPIDLLDVPVVQPADVGIAPISVDAIQSEAITIEPLERPGGRN